MENLLISTFTNRDDAEKAINELSNLGISTSNLSVIMKDKEDRDALTDSTGVQVADGVATGATAGVILGGLAGLLIGIGAIVLPGLGGVLVAGPIATSLGLSAAASTTISGAVTGGAAGGLFGGLVGLGFAEDDARFYENSVRDGHILLSFPVNAVDETQAKIILENNNAQQVRTVQSIK